MPPHSLHDDWLPRPLRRGAASRPRTSLDVTEARTEFGGHKRRARAVSGEVGYAIAGLWVRYPFRQTGRLAGWPPERRSGGLDLYLWTLRLRTNSVAAQADRVAVARLLQDVISRAGFTLDTFKCFFVVEMHRC